MKHYFPFTITGNFAGTYSPYSSSSFAIPTGNISQPSDTLKFIAGTNAWSQTPQNITFLNGEVAIATLHGTDWNTTLKNKWFDDYLKFIFVANFLTPSEKTTLFNYVQTKDIFQQLSSPSIAYVTKNDGTNGLVIDPFLTSEISIGMTVHEFTPVMDYAKTLPNNNPLKNKIYLRHRQGRCLVSNVCKVVYKSFQDYVWCFDGLEYKDYDISNIGLVPSITNGGGNFFGEVKLGGDYIQAHYIVKKNVNHNDPTFGLCSGDGKPFCIGDEIVIVDTTCWTTYNSTSGWTWIGDMSSMDYVWHIADITEPKVYSNIPIGDLLFPLRIIQFLLFQDFN
jgi:hypothetical protein